MSINYVDRSQRANHYTNPPPVSTTLLNPDYAAACRSNKYENAPRRLILYSCNIEKIISKQRK